MDDLAELYNNELTIILNHQLPTRTVKRQPRPSDPWFDAECWAAKRSTRRLERAAAAAAKSQDQMASVAATEAWRTQRRLYRNLRDQKRGEFWTRTVVDNRLHLVNCGGQSTRYLDVVGLTQTTTSVLTSSTSSSLIKWLLFALPRLMAHRLPTHRHRLVLSSVTSNTLLLMKW